MKQKSVPTKMLSLISTLSLCAGLLTACGSKFEVNSEASAQVRPPVTSDPLTSEEQRRWESEQDPDDMWGPLLETDTERESFRQDLMEEKRSYTDDQLAKDAEEQFQKNEKKRAEKEEKKKDKDLEEIPEEPLEETPDSLPQTTPKGDVVTPPIKPAPPKTTGPVVPPAAPAKPAPPKKTSVKSQFCDGLNVTKANGEYDLSELYNEDASLATSMPTEELNNARSVEKKNKFVCILLPIAVRMNEEVYRQRLEVIRLMAKKKNGLTLTTVDQKWLDNMKVAYNLTIQNSDADLLKRVDIIPLPLLLAQAALESGWGRSRAAGSLKNLFGMHAAAGQPCEKSHGGTGACIRKFNTLPEGVSAYIRLLNVGKYYEKFREARGKMRAASDPLDSLKLLETLGNYNETPAKYIQQVREMMITHNKFMQFEFNEEQVEAKNP